MSDSSNLASVKPVFIKHSDLVSSDTRYSVAEICEAAERTTGVGSIYGCQKIGGVWRIYAKSEAARIKLSSVGFHLRGQRIIASPVNPKAIYVIDGITVKASRLVISNIPLSFQDRALKEAIASLGYEPLDNIQLENARDSNGRLTTFKNGNRFIFIKTPTNRLPKSIQLEKFTAYLYYQERTEVESTHSAISPLLNSAHDRETAVTKTTKDRSVSRPRAERASVSKLTDANSTFSIDRQSGADIGGTSLTIVEEKTGVTVRSVGAETGDGKVEDEVGNQIETRGRGGSESSEKVGNLDQRDSSIDIDKFSSPAVYSTPLGGKSAQPEAEQSGSKDRDDDRSGGGLGGGMGETSRQSRSKSKKRESNIKSRRRTPPYENITSPYFNNRPNKRFSESHSESPSKRKISSNVPGKT